MLHTTGRLARNARACEEEYAKVAAALGGNAYGLDTPVPLSRVLEIAGLDAALWCLRCVLPGEERARDRIARLFACDCAERVLHIYERDHPDDVWPRLAIEVARRFAQGKATIEELQAAREASWEAWMKISLATAGAAAEVAWAASWVTCVSPWVAALRIAVSSAWAAAVAAAGNTTRDAAKAAAMDSAADAERKSQAGILLGYLTDAVMI